MIENTLGLPYLIQEFTKEPLFYASTDRILPYPKNKMLLSYWQIALHKVS